MADFSSNGLDSKVHSEELLNSVTDEYGVIYSNDRRKLLKISSSFSSQDYTVVNGCVVICDNAFAKSSSLTEIHVPSSVSLIGRKAFEACENLSQITLPASLQIIEDECFAWCSSLQNISLPKNLQTIKDGAFEGCDSIKNLTLPNSLAFIGSNAFKGLSSISRIEIPASVYEIKDEAFANCFSLKEVVFKDKVGKLSEDCFKDCDKLEFIIVADADLKYFESHLPENLKGILTTEKKRKETSPTVSAEKKTHISLEKKAKPTEEKKKALGELLFLILNRPKKSSKRETPTVSGGSYPPPYSSGSSSSSGTSTTGSSSSSNSSSSTSSNNSRKSSSSGISTSSTGSQSSGGNKPYSDNNGQRKKTKWGKIFAGLLVFALLAIVALCLIFYFVDSSDNHYDYETAPVTEEVAVYDYSEELKPLWSSYLGTNEGKIMNTVANRFYFTRNEDFNSAGFEKLMSEDVSPQFVENVGVPSILRNLAIQFTPPVDLKPVMTPDLLNLYETSLKNPVISHYLDSINWNPIEEINRHNVFTIRNIQLWGNDSLAYLYYFPGEFNSEVKPSVLSMALDNERWKINDFIDEEFSLTSYLENLHELLIPFTGTYVWKGERTLGAASLTTRLSLRYEDGDVVYGSCSTSGLNEDVKFEKFAYENGYFMMMGVSGEKTIILQLKKASDTTLEGEYQVVTPDDDRTFSIVLTAEPDQRAMPELKLPLEGAPAQ